MTVTEETKSESRAFEADVAKLLQADGAFGLFRQIRVPAGAHRPMRRMPASGCGMGPSPSRP